MLKIRNQKLTRKKNFFVKINFLKILIENLKFDYFQFFQKTHKYFKKIFIDQIKIIIYYHVLRNGEGLCCEKCNLAQQLSIIDSKERAL